MYVGSIDRRQSWSRGCELTYERISPQFKSGFLKIPKCSKNLFPSTGPNVAQLPAGEGRNFLKSKSRWSNTRGQGKFNYMLLYESNWSNTYLEPTTSPADVTRAGQVHFNWVPRANYESRRCCTRGPGTLQLGTSSQLRVPPMLHARARYTSTLCHADVEHKEQNLIYNVSS